MRSRINGNYRNDGIEDANQMTSNSRYDPLKWFGVLVPYTLKQTQNRFVNALYLSIECANIQKEIDTIVERKSILMRQLEK